MAQKLKNPKDSDQTRFDGNGVEFRGKMIGSEDIEESRGDKLCSDALTRLKGVVKTSGAHKPKIIINITKEGLRITEVISKEVIFNHAVHRISFISRDPTDNRAFGYIYSDEDGKHRFFAIKTTLSAESLVLTLRDLFTLVYHEQSKDSSDGPTENATPETITEPPPVVSDLLGTGSVGSDVPEEAVYAVPYANAPVATTKDVEVPKLSAPTNVKKNLLDLDEETPKTSVLDDFDTMFDQLHTTDTSPKPSNEAASVDLFQLATPNRTSTDLASITTSTPNPFMQGQTTPLSRVPSIPPPTNFGSSPAAPFSTSLPPNINQSSPFGLAQSSPFGTNQSSPFSAPVANQSSPFGAATANQSSPFGSAPASQASPFGEPAANQASPFGGPAANQQSPFGTAPAAAPMKSSPFAPAPTSNLFNQPFSTPPTTSTNPFPAPSMTSTNPFPAASNSPFDDPFFNQSAPPAQPTTWRNPAPTNPATFPSTEPVNPFMSQNPILQPNVQKPEMIRPGRPTRVSKDVLFKDLVPITNPAKPFKSPKEMFTDLNNVPKKSLYELQNDAKSEYVGRKTSQASGTDDDTDDDDEYSVPNPAALSVNDFTEYSVPYSNIAHSVNNTKQQSQPASTNHAALNDVEYSLPEYESEPIYTNDVIVRYTAPVDDTLPDEYASINDYTVPDDCEYSYPNPAALSTFTKDPFAPLTPDIDSPDPFIVDKPFIMSKIPLIPCCKSIVFNNNNNTATSLPVKSPSPPMEPPPRLPPWDLTEPSMDHPPPPPPRPLPKNGYTNHIVVSAFQFSSVSSAIRPNNLDNESQSTSFMSSAKTLSSATKLASANLSSALTNVSTNQNSLYANTQLSHSNGVPNQSVLSVTQSSWLTNQKQSSQSSGCNKINFAVSDPFNDPFFTDDTTQESYS